MKKKFVCRGSFFLLLFNSQLTTVAADQLETQVVVEFQNEYIPSKTAVPQQKVKNSAQKEESSPNDDAGIQSKSDATKNTQTKNAQAYLPKTNERLVKWAFYGFILIVMVMILLKKRSAQYEK